MATLRPAGSTGELRAQGWLAAALGLLMAFGILTLWVEELWAVSVVQVGIYALAGAWLIGFVWSGFELRTHPLMIPLAGAALWGCLQLALDTTVYRWATEVAVLDWFTRLAVFFLALQVFADGQTRSLFLRGALWFSLALAVLAVLQRYTSPGRVLWLFEVERAASHVLVFPNRNQFVAFLELVAPLAAVRAVTDRELRFVYLAAAGTMLGASAGLGSRAGSGLLLVTLAASTFLATRKVGFSWRKFTAVGGGLAAASVVAVLVIGWETMAVRVMEPRSWTERVNIYRCSLRMVPEHPVAGFGLRTWPVAFPAYADFDDGMFDNQAHNDWLQWLIEGGWPLALLLAGWPLLLMGPAARSAWGVGLLAVAIHSLVDYHFQQRPVFGYFYFLWAGAAVRAAEGRFK